MYSFIPLRKVNAHIIAQLWTGTKHFVALLLLLAFTSQICVSFNTHLNITGKKAVENTADEPNIESEGSSEVQDFPVLKKGKWVQKIPPLPNSSVYFPSILSHPSIAHIYLCRPDTNVSGLHTTASPFDKTPRYVAFHSLTFYEV
jgi:hypothetical protein